MRRPEININEIIPTENISEIGVDGALVCNGVIIARVWHWTGNTELGPGVTFVAGCMLPVGTMI